VSRGHPPTALMSAKDDPAAVDVNRTVTRTNAGCVMQ
jgi:hypothetical protein